MVITRAAQHEALFGRHIDLAPLRGRRRGVVRCCFHSDRTASLSIDLDRGLFNCFGCGVRGGTRKFAELVGEQPETAPSRPYRWRSPLENASRSALDALRHQPWAREDVLLGYELADRFRGLIAYVRAARAEVTAMGDSATAWDLLEQAARMEREAWAIGAEW